MRQFFQVNRYGGVLWFNQESFDQFLGWMLTLAVVQISADPVAQPEEVADSIRTCYSIIEALQQAEEASEYQVTKLVEATSG